MLELHASKNGQKSRQLSRFYTNINTLEIYVLKTCSDRCFGFYVTHCQFPSDFVTHTFYAQWNRVGHVDGNGILFNQSFSLANICSVTRLEILNSIFVIFSQIMTA